MRRHSTLREHKARFALTIVLLAAWACGGDAGRGGTVIIATAQDPETLFPPTVEWVEARMVTELLFDKLADLGPSLNTVGDQDFQPRLADHWDWSRDSLAITFHIDPRARWHDGRPVQASDVRFAFSVYLDPAVNAHNGGDLRGFVDSISVGDSVTCTAWFHRRTPEQFYTLVSTLMTLPEHLLGRVPHDSLRTSAFARAPVGNGPFRLARWEPQQRVEVTANETFARGRPKLDRVIWTFAPEASTLVQQLFAGGADFYQGLSPADVASAAQHPDIRVLRLGSYNYAFAQLNLRDGATERPHPLFSDRALRRALTMALDRPTMVRSVFDTVGQVGLGPFVRAQWSADTTLRQIAFDRAGAARTLDSLGWRTGPDGVLVRNGHPLAFGLLVPSSSKTRQSMAVLMQEQFRQVGVKVDIEVLDFKAFGARLKARRFDMAMGALTASPSPSGIRQNWTRNAAAEGGFNYGRYESPAFDAQVDSALAARDASSAKHHYRVAYQLMVDDAPAIWLFEPPALAGANQRLQVGSPRLDAWWMGLPAWTIAAGGRSATGAPGQNGSLASSAHVLACHRESELPFLLRAVGVADNSVTMVLSGRIDVERPLKEHCQ
jgi:peptide/nickel transport system substrate-binding protein